MLRRLLAFLDARTSHRAGLVELFESPLPGGAHWARTFGALTLILFGVEALTGIGLSAWYAPTTTDAWATVHFIQNKLELGWLLRGIHHVAGNVLIVIAILHVVQGLVWGAWKAPRELSWIAALGALQALILISHTGYLLPWDLRAYWATQVLIGITGNQPIVGELAAQVIQGGAVVGNATLTHLYSLHVLLTPGLFAGAIAVQLWLKRKHGELTPAGMLPERAAERAQTYSPYQTVRDLAAAGVVLAGIVLWVWREHGVPLAAPADPSIEYIARPEWYFLPIFALRHWFTGSTEFIATTVLPGLAVTFLASLPFVYDRLSKRFPHAGAALVAACLAGMAGTIALGVKTAMADASNPDAQKVTVKTDALAAEASALAMIGVPVKGPMYLYENDDHVWGKRVFERECTACHASADLKPYDAALCLDGYASRAWLTRLLRDPAAPHFFGNTKIDLMDKFTGDDEKLAQLVEFLYSQTGRPNADANPALVNQGAVAYEKEGCAECHTLDGVGNGEAPDLKGWASPAWLAAFIRQPDHPRFYGSINEMDTFDAEKLTKDEVRAVITYLHARSGERVTF